MGGEHELPLFLVAFVTRQAALADLFRRSFRETEYLGLIATPFDVGGTWTMTGFATMRSRRDTGFLGRSPVGRSFELLVDLIVATLAGLRPYISRARWTHGLRGRILLILF